MSQFSKIFSVLVKVLSHTLSVHVYSTPTFAMETFMSLLLCLVQILLLTEINDMIHHVKVPPIKVRIREPPQGSSHSVNKGILRNHPDLGVDILFKENHACRNEWDTMGKINKILSSTLSEYIRRDLRSINSNLITEEGDGNKDDALDLVEETSSPRISSMEKIYDYLLQEPEMQRRIHRINSKEPSDKEVIRLH